MPTVSYNTDIVVWIVISIVALTGWLNASITWSVVGKTPTGTIITVIDQSLDPGWHTYWKNPGDSGAPATMRSHTSDVVFEDLAFPQPTAFSTEGLITYGYINLVRYTLPIHAPPDTTMVSATMSWLICKDICIPKNAILSLDIPKNIVDYTPTTPLTPTVTITHDGKNLTITLPKSIQNAVFYPYTNGDLYPHKQRQRGNRIHIPMVATELSRISGELFWDDQSHTISQPVTRVSRPYKSLFMTLLSAFVGGLLLNVMPCVFPILGIKALQIQKPSIKEALYYGAGVWASLLALCSLILGLKQAGHAVGWGFQLQSPLVIAGLIILFLTIILINISAIAIPIPRFLAKKTQSAFLSGILTTIIATPCTAPFLGSALAIALFQSPWISLATFTLIAAGLALPMMLIMMHPKTAQYLPKTGAWNTVFKHSVTLGLSLTVVWLFSVLYQQIPLFMYAVMGGVIVIGMSVLAYKHRRPGLLLITLVILPPLLYTRMTPTSTTDWIPYSPDTIAAFEQTQQPYFIDVTATWCITCQTNKLTVLNTRAAQALFKKHSVRTVRADWTQRHPDITQLLERHNKASIPTYIYFDGQSHYVFDAVLSLRILTNRLQSPSR